MLDSRLKNSGGAGPPKWEPCSRIGVYLGKSPFHAVSVALVWNPTIGCISPQYYVLFDNEFSTVPYMEAGTIPPNWYNIVKYSTKMDTPQDVDLADTWLRGQSNEGASDPISDPFALIITNIKIRIPQDILLLIKTSPHRFTRETNRTKESFQLLSL